MKFKAEQTQDKLRGGYYTPPHLASYIAKWVVSGIKTKKPILEPSCGDGVFFKALSLAGLPNNHRILGFELMQQEADKSNDLCNKLGFDNYNIFNGDFLSWANTIDHAKFRLAGVVGNPPFIRYQFLESEFQKQAELVFKRLGLKFTKHTNAWVSFVLASIDMLDSGARLGMVIPAEIIHVTHARSLRAYLEKTCSKVLLINPKELWFGDTLQGAVIICAEKKRNHCDPCQGIGIQQVSGLDFLNTDPDKLYLATNKIKGKTSEGKWTKGLLTKAEWQLVLKANSHKDVHLFTDIGTVDVGIVTGANAFFLVDCDTIKEHDLFDYAYPMFGRSQHCKGVIYDETQHHENMKNNLPCNFLYIEQPFADLPSNVQNYIATGESQELHTRYKCRIRKPWYKVPSVYATNLAMLKRCHNYPRLIFNKMQAYTTDTAYRITSKINPKVLSTCFINPITAIAAELEGRSYGGGVLELVPSEIARLHIPINNKKDNITALNDKFKDSTLSDIDVMVENGKNVLLGMGFADNEVTQLIEIWLKLKNRRIRK